MSINLIDIIEYLLPGFLAAWIFYGLSAHDKPGQFERIIQALIFTTLVQALSTFVELFWIQPRFTANRSTPIDSKILFSALYAAAIGSIFAWSGNRDFPHRLLRFFKITEQTSYPSEWFGVFSKQKSYIVLHLNDERRLYGWPKEWPQSSEKGHSYIMQPSWLLEQPEGADPSGEVPEEYLGDNMVEGILINVSDVKWVEVMQKVQ